MLEVVAPPAAREERLLDADTTTSSTAAPNSSLSLASNVASLPRCSSLSRLSFDCSPTAALSVAAAPTSFSLAPARPHRSKDAAWGGDPRSFDVGRGAAGALGLQAKKKKKKKLERAAAEKRIPRVLDHPFLPTLFADFDAAPHFSCVVTEFCPGGDLHS